MKIKEFLPPNTTVKGWWEDNVNFFAALELEKVSSSHVSKFLHWSIERDIVARNIQKDPFLLERLALEIDQPEWNYFRFKRTSLKPN